MSTPTNRRNSRNSRRAPERFGLVAWFTRVRRRLLRRGTARRDPTNARPERAPAAEIDDGMVIAPRVLFARIGATVAAGVCIALILGVALSMDSYSSRTKQFKLRNFEVSGLLRTEESALLTASGLRVGSPLLDVSIRNVRVAIEALPWVRRADVRIEMPGTVFLHVEEHVPAAMVVDGPVALVDTGGNLIKRLDVGGSHELPVITGVSVDALRCKGAETGSAARQRAAHCALARRTLLRMLSVVARWQETSVAQRFPVGEVNWDAVLGVTVMSARDGAEVRIGHRDGEDLSRVIAQLDRLLTTLDGRGERLRYALMDDETSPERAIIDAVAAAKWVAVPTLHRAAGPAHARLPTAAVAPRPAARGAAHRAGPKGRTIHSQSQRSGSPSGKPADASHATGQAAGRVSPGR